MTQLESVVTDIWSNPRARRHTRSLTLSVVVPVYNAEQTLADLRASTGLSLQWQAPIGPLIINFAVPFRKKDADNRFVERIQFTFGNQF